MPQMSPYNWLILFLIFNFIFIFIMTHNHFMLSPKIYNLTLNYNNFFFKSSW